MPLGSRQNYRNPGEGRGPFFNIPERENGSRLAPGLRSFGAPSRSYFAFARFCATKSQLIR